MTAQQERKQAIRSFMRAHYTDERLAQLLAHAQDGKLNYSSCCCFVGIVTADHSIQSQDRCETNPSGEPDHLNKAHRLMGADQAENAFLWLTGAHFTESTNEIRRRILIPMIRAEMRRRALAAQTALQAEVQRVAELSPLDVMDLETIA